MNQRFIDLYDSYTHSHMPRREFIRQLTRLAGSAAAASVLLPLLEVNYAQAEVIAKDDARLVTRYTQYPSEAGLIKAYQAKPAADDAPLPAVLVIHENKGLNPHIEDVARRVALAGYLALAPDVLSPTGGSPSDPDEAKNLLRAMDSTVQREIFLAAVETLKADARGNSKVGCVGFCWGGAMANQLAAHSPHLAAAVAFYGRQLPAEEVPSISAPILLHYAGLDQRINAGIDAYKAALDAAGKSYQLHMYDGVNHAFHNDTAPSRYNEAAAKLAWQRTLAFFAKHLS